MNRTNFILLTSFSVLIIGGGIYFLVKRKRDKNLRVPLPLPVPNGNNLDTDNTNATRNWDLRNQTPGTPEPVINETPILYTDKDFPLKRGSGGPKVKLLQQFLNNNTKINAQPPLRVDGKFGPLTEAALRAWQGDGNGQMTEVEYYLFVSRQSSASKGGNQNQVMGGGYNMYPINIT